MTQFYWNSYKRLEKEFLLLTEVIHISDDQLGVYSSKIGDLLVRTAIECEALVKDLYHANGGTKPSGKDLYFDTDCFAHLVDIWKIDKKEVFVTTPYVYFEREENRTLLPLRKSHKRGTSSSNWQKAYQAVKHDRVNNLKSGSVGNLLLALAALYILNIYYRNVDFPSVIDKEGSNIDWGMGSELFSVKVCYEQDGSSVRSIYEKKPDYDESIYFIKHTDKTGQAVIDAFSLMDKQISEQTLNASKQSIEAQIKLGKLDPNGESFTQEMDKIITEQRANAFQRVAKLRGREIAQALQALQFEALLNKQQY